ncbi:Protein of unknown function [Verrucomicrobium sp. GAS474]|uniref:DUF2721 domain-containing protein n=1 Tax=Verrucomicrobium sp. GAS474 TaxID=1882831 RepID=UPI00087CF34D|nr:DUF2721 domain-containing protein [Verrucomicrobium sp. GAS474]SDT88360.1 Protein of unknown function [Verrucomicrobium sp. GAS474]
MIDPAAAQAPFSALTFIVAPALLTNATSVLAMSTINRHLRTRDRMHELYKLPDPKDESAPDRARRMLHVDRIQRQGELLLHSLHAIYIALAAFSGSTLVTLLGASLATVFPGFAYHLFINVGLVLGCVGVGGLMLGSWQLFRATQLSLVNMQMEADAIRNRGATIQPLG